jgi:hypothetical protein
VIGFNHGRLASGGGYWSWFPLHHSPGEYQSKMKMKWFFRRACRAVEWTPFHRECFMLKAAGNYLELGLSKRAIQAIVTCFETLAMQGGRDDITDRRFLLWACLLAHDIPDLPKNPNVTIADTCFWNLFYTMDSFNARFFIETLTEALGRSFTTVLCDFDRYCRWRCQPDDPDPVNPPRFRPVELLSQIGALHEALGKIKRKNRTV